MSDEDAYLPPEATGTAPGRARLVLDAGATSFG
jgi:hypothetical protein